MNLVILAAGTSSRFSSKTKKQWLRTRHKPLWLILAKKLAKTYDFSKIIIVSSKLECKYMRNFSDDFIFVEGGDTRQESLINALKQSDSIYTMVTDSSRVFIDKNTIDELIKNKEKASCIVPFIAPSDSCVYENEPINRDEVKLIQTPQLSKTSVLKKAVEQASKNDKIFTDESSCIKALGENIFYVKGSKKALKLTFNQDKAILSKLKAPSKDVFTGFGYDLHAFCENKKMYLGGLDLGFDYGFKAHSDGDVLIHALIDALLGAVGAGDIGDFFPDNDEKYKNISSVVLLETILNFIHNIGFRLINIDFAIKAQKPKISPFKEEIKTNLSKILGLKKQFINIKATTEEGFGCIGEGLALSVYCLANLKYHNWKK